MARVSISWTRPEPIVWPLNNVAVDRVRLRLHASARHLSQSAGVSTRYFIEDASEGVERAGLTIDALHAIMTEIYDGVNKSSVNVGGTLMLRLIKLASGGLTTFVDSESRWNK
ncbi:hypothetical protein KIN20_032924 [Parelaphostrongylus tenuis]|uniref:Uncharacterized protein n=1 Tax=Parelaphostrongylus tenuis TaxID=148309 RepID=A0AAD5R9J0_PARTN|nr:hypothetical protein KIN20_032924 [Parelaphostrongylus tenuis]